MKYGTTSTWKGRRRWGRHGTGGHSKNKPGSNKGGIAATPKPSRTAYFASCRWLENKRKRIAKKLKARKVG